MDVIWFILKILLMLCLVAVMGAPLLAEYLSFLKDKTDSITHKRFRIFVYSVVYFLVVTVLLVLLKDLLILLRIIRLSFGMVLWDSLKLILLQMVFLLLFQFLSVHC